MAAQITEEVIAVIQEKMTVAWPGVFLVGVMRDVQFWIYSKAGIDGIC